MARITSVDVTSGIPTAGTGTVATLDGVLDATNGPAAIKPPSTAPVAADKALVVAISPNSVNANGPATSANSAPVVIASDQAWPVGTTGFMKKEDVASADGDAGIPAMAIQRATPADTAADLDYSMLQMSGGGLWVKQAPQGASAAITFTPAASSHNAGDCVGAAGNFASLGVSGSSIMITSATLYIDNTAALATAWRVHLYNVTPSSAIADDAAWDFADADVAQYLGSFDLPSTATDIGTNQWAQADGINKQVKMSGTGLFAYLQCLSTVTTTATAHIVTINVAPV